MGGAQTKVEAAKFACGLIKNHTNFNLTQLPVPKRYRQVAMNVARGVDYLLTFAEGQFKRAAENISTAADQATAEFTQLAATEEINRVIFYFCVGVMILLQLIVLITLVYLECKRKQRKKMRMSRVSLPPTAPSGSGPPKHRRRQVLK